MTKKNGFAGMIIMHSWMFLSRYQALRLQLLNYTLENVLHLGSRAFEDIGGEVVQTASFVIRKAHFSDYIGKFEKLTELADSQEKIGCYLLNQEDFFDSKGGTAYDAGREN